MVQGWVEEELHPRTVRSGAFNALPVSLLWAFIVSHVRQTEGIADVVNSPHPQARTHTVPQDPSQGLLWASRHGVRVTCLGGDYD